jgi:hypothetical protein
MRLSERSVMSVLLESVHALMFSPNVVYHRLTFSGHRPLRESH